MIELTARSRSASRHTSAGALPPSSSDTRVRLFAAVAITRLPVLAWPVKETSDASGERTSASPVWPAPQTRLITPAGNPMCASTNRTNSSVANGLISLGLITTVLPVTSAGPSLRHNTARGKFHGQIATTTPTGARNRWITSPGLSPGRISPSSRRSPLGVVAQEARRELHLAARLLQRLADLLGHQLRQALAVGVDQVGHLPQVRATRRRRRPRPLDLRPPRRREHILHISLVAGRDARDHVLIRRVEHVKALAMGRAPTRIEVQRLLPNRRRLVSRHLVAFLGL